MGLLLLFLAMALCVTFSELSIHGSADHIFSPGPTPPSSGRKRHREVLPPPNRSHHIASPKHHSSAKGAYLLNAKRPSSIALAPSSLSNFRGHAQKRVHGPASSPAIPFHKQQHVRKKSRDSAPGPAYPAPAPSYSQQGPSVSPFQSPLPASSWSSHAPAPSPKVTSSHLAPSLQPSSSPIGSSLKKMKAPPPSTLMTLPPPPPNDNCALLTCSDPLTYTPPGSPCGCVWPIQVKLSLDIPIYTFFPLISQLAEETAAGVGLNHNQVRIMGANAARQQLEKSTVLINIVPSGVKFNDTTAFSVYKKFRQRKVLNKASSAFGSYEVLYVHYPGLPSSPPSHSSISMEDDGPYAGRDNKRQALKPLGVDVPMRKKAGLKGSMIAIIVLSSFAAFILCFGVVLSLLKCKTFHQPEQIPHDWIYTPAKPSGTTRTMRFGSALNSSSISFDSSAVPYTGTAKTFTLNDIERATNFFNTSRIIGEGGFGVVYRGILDDGREVAVKVLKRADQHGGHEFLAEVEMLSRLHHRNLVKLYGICTEESSRCLVYELIHNGSLESHLHGDDKRNDPLDWEARMKIALGAARGLAYLHEDSSPRVIHRDFKSSNILLEHDYTPKVSDFGLARSALEGNKHISTHVMGTFGYLAPEYAMTGHLLVKSDVYSYGVVLLELLTGRNPVDLSQPPGKKNLVAWTRPLLTSREGLETIVDPLIKSSVSYDSMAKVGAIASMCVQPEVSHRPFMGEVVQALQLVCNEFDETKEIRESRDLIEDFHVSLRKL